MKIPLITSIVLIFSQMLLGQIKNGGFENWHSISNIPAKEDPDFWTSTNVMDSGSIGILKSTDAFEGNYAVKIIPKIFDLSLNGATTCTAISYGISNQTALSFYYGFYIKDTLSFLPSKMTGFYKRIKTNYVNKDTAFVRIILNKTGTAFGYSGYGEFGFLPNNSYQYFEVDILTDPGSDSIGISFLYDSQDTSSNNGGYLLIDDLGLAPTVKVEEWKDVEIKIYPNPASDYLYFEHGKEIKVSRIEVFSLDGKLVKTINDIPQTPQQLDIRDIQKGYYMIRITSNYGIGTQKILIHP